MYIYMCLNALINKNNEIEKLSSFNEVALGQYVLGNTVEINYKAPDGMNIQGWYITPPKFDKSKKYYTQFAFKPVFSLIDFENPKNLIFWTPKILPGNFRGRVFSRVIFSQGRNCPWGKIETVCFCLRKLP